MLVNLSQSEYEWFVSNAPFPVIPTLAVLPASSRCDTCGHADNHYDSCANATRSNRLIDNCTCGEPRDRAFYHYYDGSPCAFLDRTDV